MSSHVTSIDTLLCQEKRQVRVQGDGKQIMVLQRSLYCVWDGVDDDDGDADAVSKIRVRSCPIIVPPMWLYEDNAQTTRACIRLSQPVGPLELTGACEILYRVAESDSAAVNVSVCADARAKADAATDNEVIVWLWCTTHRLHLCNGDVILRFDRPGQTTAH
jgi:hypothetical protein